MAAPARRFVFIEPQRIYGVAETKFFTLEELAARLRADKAKGPLLFGLLPQAVGRVLATERTIDTVLSHQYPGANSFSLEPLESNVYQVFVASNELLDQLRQLGRDVSLVPYPAAVRAALMTEKQRRDLGFLERTRVFLTGDDEVASREGKETVAIDILGEDLLITALREREVLAVRLAHGGDPVLELTRTLAASRLENPVIFARDEQLVLELKSQGFDAQEPEQPGTFVGEGALDKVLELRFLTELEVAQKRAREHRAKAARVFVVSLVLGGLAAGGFNFFRTAQTVAAVETARLEGQKQQRLGRLVGLYQERFASIARQDSLQFREELYDLLVSLPPQVALVSLEKDGQGLSAVLERLPGAAPFSRDDLRSALATSPFFADARIREEYEGHVVRYVLTRPAALEGGSPP